jgi:Leucine-rich repeat (LRR) protein
LKYITERRQLAMFRFLLKSIVCLNLVVFLLVYNTFIQAQVDAHQEYITLIDSDGGEIEFPSYLIYISPLIKDLLSMGFTESDSKKIKFTLINHQLLQKLKECIDLLPMAARDRNGKPVDETNINKETIFVNRLVKEAISREIFDENLEVEQLFLASRFLEIEVLTNTFGYFIAKKSLKDEDLGLFTEEPIIQKYRYLLSQGKEEQTIEDYIGLNGKPYGLASKGFTSLKGIDLIDHPERITNLNLSGNCILGPDLDPQFPERPFQKFRQLKTINLNRNHLRSLSNEMFFGLSELKQIYLNHNQLTTLPKGLFDYVVQLERIQMIHNQLSTLPEGMCDGLNQLKEFYIGHNKFPDSSELFRTKYGVGEGTKFIFNPQKP